MVRCDILRKRFLSRLVEEGKDRLAKSSFDTCRRIVLAKKWRFPLENASTARSAPSKWTINEGSVHSGVHDICETYSLILRAYS